MLNPKPWTTNPNPNPNRTPNVWKEEQAGLLQMLQGLQDVVSTTRKATELVEGDGTEAEVDT